LPRGRFKRAIRHAVLAVAVLVIASGSNSPPTNAAGEPFALTFKGFNYVSYYNGALAAADSLPTLAASGPNAVAIDLEYGIDVKNSTVYADVNYTDPLTSFGNAIAEAKSLGLTVMVRPLIDFVGSSSEISPYTKDEFRAYYNPANPNMFFSSYQAMLVAVAQTAQAKGADILCIGVELDQLTGPAFKSNWQSIIAAVKAVFKGKLIYSALWDDNLSPWQDSIAGTGLSAGTGNIATQVSFCGDLDYVGLDWYAPVSDATTPTLSQLIAGWTQVPSDPTSLAVTGNQSLISYVEGVANQLGMPIIFTELGYESATDAASQPAYTSTNAFDPSLQADLYQAFFTAWQQNGDNSLAGVYFWNWDPNVSEVGPNNGANFSPQELPAQQVMTTNFGFPLSVSVGGSGSVTSAPSGIDCGSTCSLYFAAGTQVALTASPASGDSFAGWDGACSGTGVCNVTINAAQTVTATFTQQTTASFTLTVNNPGNGTVTSSDGMIECGPTCSAVYVSGIAVNLTASPATGFGFSGWGGACSGAGGCAVTMNGNESISATFTQNTAPSFQLSVGIAGSGTVSTSPAGFNCSSPACGANFTAGTVVNLTEMPGVGFSFAGWGGACSGLGTCAVTMNAAQGVSASFTQASGGASPLVAAVLPASRSVMVGGTATAFATIINTGGGTAPGCAIAPIGGLPLDFVYQTTNPATNALTGLADTPADIAAGRSQSFVVALTPISAFSPTTIDFSFACSNIVQASITSGLNTLLLSAATTPVPDVVALAASGDPGYVDIPGATGTGDFAVATVNLGADATITAAANSGTTNLPVSVLICQTNPSTGACLAPPAASVTTDVQPKATPTFGIFVTGSATVADMPGVNRIFATFIDSSGLLRGETSVAVRTQ
jgi:hypothetical protein